MQTKFLSGLMVCGALIMSSPLALAQPQDGLTPLLANQAETTAGNFIAAAASNTNLQSVRDSAVRLGETLSQGDPAVLSRVVSSIAANFANAKGGDKTQEQMRQFIAGLTAGLVSGNPAQARQSVSLGIAAGVSGAGQNEARVGEVSRIVASGAVEALVMTQTTIPVSEMAGLIQAGVSQGASQVVGREVTVSVLSTDDKPVSDVVLTTADGKQLDRGWENIVFIGIPNDGDKEKNKKISSPS